LRQLMREAFLLEMEQKLGEAMLSGEIARRRACGGTSSISWQRAGLPRWHGKRGWRAHMRSGIWCMVMVMARCSR
jgi:hypothetical protein